MLHEGKRAALERELERFVQFGTVLDTRTRRYLVAWMRAQFQPQQLPEDLQAAYFDYFKKELERLFANEALLRVGQRNEILGLQIVRDILTWFRTTYEKIAAQHPFEDEQMAIGGWAIRPYTHFTESWPSLFRQIAMYYSSMEFSTAYYAAVLKAATGVGFDVQDTITKKKLEFLFTDVLSQWDAKLQAKILEFQMSHFQEAFETFKETLEQKVAEFERLTTLLNPFADYLHKYWDLSRELYENTNFDVLHHYEAVLKQSEQVQKLADLLGRMRQAEVASEEDLFEKTFVHRKWVTDPTMPVEVEGITTHNSIKQALTTELALLTDAATETSFLKKFADHQLLGYQLSDKRLVQHQEIFSEAQQRIKQKKKGPFIICVDTSGSMEGAPERIAKVLCFAILKMAAASNRSAYLINFSQGIKVLDLKDIAASISDLAHFLKMSFRGGTDISLALHEALQQLETQQYKDADVLVISDFIMYKVSEDLTRRMEQQRFNRSTLFHNVTISDQGNQEVIACFDNNWVYDPDAGDVIAAVHRDLAVLKR